MSEIVITRYDCTGAMIDRPRVISGTWEASTDGSDILELEVLGELNKYDYLVWSDGTNWHEHVVDTVTTSSTSAGAIVSKATAIDSIHELAAYGTPPLVQIENMQPYAAIGAILTECGTAVPLGWTCSSSSAAQLVTLAGDNATDTYSDLYTLIVSIADMCGLEIQKTITPTATLATFGRTFSLVEAVGDPTPRRRYEYRAGLVKATRTITSSECVQVATPGGVDFQDDNGEHRNKNLFDLSDGAATKYIYADAASTSRWGYLTPTGMLPRNHRRGDYVWDSVDDFDTLDEVSRAQLSLQAVPEISYTCEISDVLAPDGSAVGLGDVVQVIDPGLGLQIEDRVTKIRRSLTGERLGTVYLGQSRNVSVMQQIKKEQQAQANEKAIEGGESLALQLAENVTNSTPGGTALKNAIGGGGGGGLPIYDPRGNVVLDYDESTNTLTGRIYDSNDSCTREIKIDETDGIRLKINPDDSTLGIVTPEITLTDDEFLLSMGSLVSYGVDAHVTKNSTGQYLIDVWTRSQQFGKFGIHLGGDGIARLGNNPDKSGTSAPGHNEYNFFVAPNGIGYEKRAASSTSWTQTFLSY